MPRGALDALVDALAASAPSESGQHLVEDEQGIGQPASFFLPALQLRPRLLADGVTAREGGFLFPDAPPEDGEPILGSPLPDGIVGLPTGAPHRRRAGSAPRGATSPTSSPARSPAA